MAEINVPQNSGSAKFDYSLGCDNGNKVEFASVVDWLIVTTNQTSTDLAGEITISWPEKTTPGTRTGSVKSTVRTALGAVLDCESITVNQAGKECGCNNIQNLNFDTISYEGITSTTVIGTYTLTNNCSGTITATVSPSIPLTFNNTTGEITTDNIPENPSISETVTYTVSLFYDGDPCGNAYIIQDSKPDIPCSCESISTFVPNVNKFLYFPLRGTSHNSDGSVTYAEVIVGSGQTAVIKDGRVVKVCGEVIAQSNDEVFVDYIPESEQTRVDPDRQINNRIKNVPIPITPEEIEEGLDPNKPYKFEFYAEILSGDTYRTGAIDLYFRKYEDVELDHCEGANLHVARTDTACDCENKPYMDVINIDGSGTFPCEGKVHEPSGRVQIGIIRLGSGYGIDIPDYMTYKAELITDNITYIIRTKYVNPDFYIIYYDETDNPYIIRYDEKVPITITDGVATVTFPYEHESEEYPVQTLTNGIPASGFSYTVTDADPRDTQLANKHGLRVYGDLPYRNETVEKRLVGIVRVHYYCGHGNTQGGIQTYCGYNDYMYYQNKCEPCDCEFLLHNVNWRYNQEENIFEEDLTIHWCEEGASTTMLYNVKNNDCLKINNIDLGEFEDIYELSGYYYEDSFYRTSYDYYITVGLKEGAQKDNRDGYIDFEIGYEENGEFVKCYDARLHVVEQKCTCAAFGYSISTEDREGTISCSCTADIKIADKDDLGSFSWCDKSCIKFWLKGPGDETKRTGTLRNYHYQIDGSNMFYAYIYYDYNNDTWYVKACSERSEDSPLWDSYPDTGVTLTVGGYIGDFETVGEVCEDAPTINVIIKKAECVTCTCDQFLNSLSEGPNVTWDTSKTPTEVKFVHHNGQDSTITIKPFYGAGCGNGNIVFTDDSGSEITKPEYVHRTDSSSDGVYTHYPSEMDVDSITEEGTTRTTYFKARSSKKFDGEYCERQFKLIETYEFKCEYADCNGYDPYISLNAVYNQSEDKYEIDCAGGSVTSISKFIQIDPAPECFRIEFKPSDENVLTLSNPYEENGQVYYDFSWGTLDKDDYTIDYYIYLEGKTGECKVGTKKIKFKNRQ